MKRIGGAALATVVGMGAMGISAPGASAVPTRDLYMVQNMQYSNGVYVGDFAALRKKGKKVVGAFGGFGSEYFCVKGKIKRGFLRATSYDAFTKPDGTFKVRWKGSRIEGMKRISKKTMRTYGASKPKRMITYCARNT